jgi:hypothetical protein
MDTSTLKLELVQRLLSITDEATLQRLVSFFKSEQDDDLTDEELIELDAEHARVLRGEGESYTIDEAMAIVREAVKR